MTTDIPDETPAPLLLWHVSLDELCRRHRVRPRGIVHVGAHHAQEREAYRRTGASAVLWIEADPLHIPQLRANLAGDPSSRVVQACLSDADGRPVPFYRSDHAGLASSMLPMGAHAYYFPSVRVTETITLTTTTFPSLVEREGIDLSAHDFLVLDVQGAELLVLRGFGDLLRGFRGVLAEVSIEPLYQGGVLMPELDAYLRGFGFSRRETLLTTGQYGDALYLHDDHYPPVRAAGRAGPLRRLLALQRRFMVRCPGQGRQPLALLEPDRVGVGGTATEQTWQVREAGHEVVLELVGEAGRSFCFRNVNDFVWVGESLFSGAAVEMVPWALLSRPLPPRRPGQSNLPVELAEGLRDALGLRDFVETGTCLGLTASALASRFRRVFTIELDPAAHQSAAAALAAFDNVTCLLGDSSCRLPEILARLDGPSLFWLDAHWSGPGTGRGATECPLLAELAAIYTHRPDHAVLVDDARLFLDPPPPYRAEDWPTIGAVCSFLASRTPAPFVRIAGDVLVAVPPAASGVVESCCRAGGEINGARPAPEIPRAPAPG